MKKKKKNTSRRKKIVRWDKVFIVIAFITVMSLQLHDVFEDNKPAENNLIYSEFKTMLDNGEIIKADIVSNKDNFKVYTADGREFQVINPKYDEFRKDILEHGVNMDIRKETVLDGIKSMIGSIPLLLISMLIAIILIDSIKSTSNAMFKVLKNGENITFDDVAGIDEIKKEVQFAVDTLKSHKELVKAGGRLVKGIILEGPPGTGKTLIAKAIAGEAKVPFISTSGSDFIEMFVGLGAARVRGLWELAKLNAPCVVFIDEIDAVGKRRNSGTGGGAEMESNQTLNALLQRMDGLDSETGILVIGATNMIDNLDPALLRAGRFDKKIYVGPPKSKKSRDEVIKVHLRGKKLENEQDFDRISKLMFGLSGAEIENCLNEAVMVSIQRGGHGVLSYEDVDNASTKLRVNGIIVNNHTDKDKELTAIHEAGHTIMSLVEGKKVQKVTINNFSSGVGGFTMCDVDSEENKFKLKSELISDIKILLGGLCAERIYYNENSFGCQNDLDRATQLVYSMLFKWGMFDTYSSIEVISQTGMSVNNTLEVASSVNNILSQMIEDVTKVLEKNKEGLDSVKNDLIKYESLTDISLEVYKV